MKANLLKLIAFTAVTTFVTVVLGMTIGNVRLGDKTSYEAEFSDVTGLLPGDDVRIAGVAVGRVEKLRVAGNRARVTFEVDSDVVLTRSIRAKVRYRNLLGQRYISLSEGGAGAARLEEDDLIPLGQTEPALDLTVLFNGFRPLLETVKPEDVNALATEIVRTLQGEGGTVDSLLAHTASLTNTLADRDAAIGRVVDNLGAIASTVADREENLGLFVAELQRLTTGLAGDREAISQALGGIDALADATADLLHDARGDLDPAIKDLGALVATAAAKSPQLDAIAKQLPAALAALTRGTSYGAWLNLYVLDLVLNVNGQKVPIPPSALDAALRGAGS